MASLSVSSKGEGIYLSIAPDCVYCKVTTDFRQQKLKKTRSPLTLVFLLANILFFFFCTKGFEAVFYALHLHFLIC